ncbi:MAG: hypothetical protein GX446_01500 [Chthonomonadales bacterium]|nr:hypothetical protein [Chthonomonadales bacterium]
MAGTYGEPAFAQLQADVQVAWTHDYTTVPYGETCSPGGSTIGGGYCTIHIHLPGSYPIASITTLVATAAECAAHGDGTVTFGGPFASGPCPPGCSQSPYTNHWNILWPISSRHNMPHTIHVEGTCSSYPPFGTSYMFQGDATITISNLIVKPTQPVNPEPILWHGDPEEPVTLRAEVSSAYKAQQAVKLRIYASDQALVKTIETTPTIGPGVSELEFEWNGSQDPPREGVAPKGIYLFKWEVGGAGPTMDYDQDKSAAMTFGPPPTTLATHVGDEDGEVVTFGRTLNDSYATDASACSVRVYERWTLNEVLTAPLPTSLGYGQATFAVPPASQISVEAALAGLGETVYLCVPIDGDAGKDRGHRNRTVLQQNQRRRQRILLTWGGKYVRDPETGARYLHTESVADAADGIARPGAYADWRVRTDRFEGMAGNPLIRPQEIMYAPYGSGAPYGLIRRAVDVAVFCGHGVANGSPRLGKVFKFGCERNASYPTQAFYACADQSTQDHYDGLEMPPVGTCRLDGLGPAWNNVANTGTPVQLVVWWGCNTTSTFDGDGLPQVTCSSMGAAYSVGFRTEWSGDEGRRFFLKFAQEQMWVGGRSTVYQGVHHGIVAGKKIKQRAPDDTQWRGYCGIKASGVSREFYRLPR